MRWLAYSNVKVHLICRKMLSKETSNVNVQFKFAQIALFSQIVLNQMHFYIPRAHKRKNAETQLHFCSWVRHEGGSYLSTQASNCHRTTETALPSRTATVAPPRGRSWLVAPRVATPASSGRSWPFPRSGDSLCTSACLRRRLASKPMATRAAPSRVRWILPERVRRAA